MKKLYAVLVLGLVVGIVCWAFGPGLINAKAKEVKASDLPEAVQKTLQERAPGAEIKEIEMDEEDGNVVYEIEVEIDGKEIELEIDVNGKILEEEVEEGDDDDEDEDRDDEDDDDDDDDDDDEDDDD